MTVESHVTVEPQVALVGAMLNPVNVKPGPTVSDADTLGAAPNPAFSTRTVHVTVSSTPASCMIGFFVTTRSGVLTVRNIVPFSESGVPGGCSKLVRLKNWPEIASQASSTWKTIVIEPPFAMPTGRLPDPGFGEAWAIQSLRVFVSLFAGLRSMELPAPTVGTDGLKAAVDAPYETASTQFDEAFRRITPSPKVFRPDPMEPSDTS